MKIDTRHLFLIVSIIKHFRIFFFIFIWMSFIISNFNYYPNHQHFQSEFIYLKISKISYLNQFYHHLMGLYFQQKYNIYFFRFQYHRHLQAL